MHPVIAKLGPFTIYSYGVLVALAFTVSIFLIYRRAEKLNIDKDKIVDICVIALISGIFGARLFYVILNIRYYISNPVEIVMISKGGLVWYGGFITAFFVMFWYLRRYRHSLLPVIDLIAPYLALAQAIGRLGCFLNGCCYGVETAPNSFLGVSYPGSTVMRVPSQIYSAVALILIFIVLRIWQDRKRFNGEIFLGYCMLASLKRFLIEFLRGDNPRLMLGLTLFQYISIVIFIISTAVFIAKVAEWRKRDIVSK